MTLTNDAKAVVALTTRLGSRNRPSLTALKWHRLSTVLSDSGHSPSDLFDRSLDLASLPGLEPGLIATIEALLSDSAAATLEADELTRRGIWVLSITDDNYPASLSERLGPKAPPTLFGAGDQSLLSEPGVGIVGSRELSEEAGEFAKAVAEQAIAAGKTVVSGGARGADQLAMNAAYMSGGRVIGVLAESLESRIRKPETLQALDEGRTCLISEQAPSSGFTPASAMSRNKIIYALSEATVVVASDFETGGTWAGATEAIKSGNGIVAVRRGEGEGPGNEPLSKRGAISITSPQELLGLLGREEVRHSDQLSLFG